MSKKYITIVIAVALAVIGSAYTVAKVAEWQRKDRTSVVVDASGQVPFSLVGSYDGYGCFLSVDLPFTPRKETWTVPVTADHHAYVQAATANLNEVWDKVEALGADTSTMQWSSRAEYLAQVPTIEELTTIEAVPVTYEIDGVSTTPQAGWHYEPYNDDSEAAEWGISTHIGPNTIQDQRNFMAALEPPTEHLTLTVNGRSFEFDLSNLAEEWAAYDCEGTVEQIDTVIAQSRQAFDSYIE